ncbi:MAG: hypothetical protein JWR83_1902 [Aeromicrobium sp.]|nr:hypothetical protein [Aeromicrobium sp.]
MNLTDDRPSVFEILDWLAGSSDGELVWVHTMARRLVRDRNASDPGPFDYEADGWDPWRVLRQRTHLTLRWARLHPQSPGEGQPIDGCLHGTTITLDSRLTRWRRAATLTHELIHDERQIMFPRATWVEMEVEEAEVRRLTRLRMAFWAPSR